jgi:DMSO/TMAO reductase YedYZ molybdopterin-dependent catalytic subunit
MPAMGNLTLPPPTRRELMALAVRLGMGSVAFATAGGLAGARGVVSPGSIGGLTSRSARPVDIETPVEQLDAFLTPLESFFVRNHMTAPAADVRTWQLAVDGGGRSQMLSVADLRALPAASVTATLECAGNGRAFFDPSVAGVQWRKGAVGTAQWTGARLRDVLARTGGAGAATHVWLHGGDRPLGSQPPFIRQVPIAKAIDADTVVAYEMNGQAIPPLHGAPLRAIVPGWEGAYSVKWLQRLTVADREHDGFWVSGAYRYPIRRVAPGTAVDARDMAPLQGLAVKSLITRPLAGAMLAPGRITVAGFAWAGESRIAKVEVSSDGGASWTAARLTGPLHKYAWRRFEHEARLMAGAHTVLSRATDDRGAVQPAVPEWNPSGYLWNAPDRIEVRVGDGVPAPELQPSPATSSALHPTYESACRVCHDDDLAAQQRLTAEGWGRTVDKMVRWGARVSPEQRQPLVEFLASRWGIR